MLYQVYVVFISSICCVHIKYMLYSDTIKVWCKEMHTIISENQHIIMNFQVMFL